MTTTIKRTALALLAVAMLAGVGCGQRTGTSDGTTDSPGAANTNPTGLPIVKEKITLTAIVSTNYNLNTPAKDLKMWQILEDETNVHLELQEIPGNGYAEKLNLRIAGDDLPDVIMNSIGEITGKYYNTKQFLPLDALIEKWAPNYQKVLSDPTLRANVTAQDGKVYATPSGEIAPWLDVTEQLFLNGEWMDKLNLTMPTNYDELYDVLKAIKDGDPNGNGLPDELPLVFRMKRDANNALYLLGGFGLPINQQYAMLKDGKYIFGPLDPRFREGLEYLHKLYADGLLDKENLTQDLSEMQAKGSGEHQLIGGLVAFWGDDYCSFDESVKFEAVPVLKGPHGDQTWLGNPNLPGPGGMSITAKCKNPEAAIRWADNIIKTPKNVYTVMSGPVELGLISETEDGKIHLNSESAPEGMTYEVWTRRMTIRDMFPYYLSQEQVLEGRTVDLNPQRKLAYIESYMPYRYPEMLTGAHTKWFPDAGVEQEATTMFADLQPLVESFISQSMMQGVTDETWNAFQDTMKKAKVERYVEIRQASVDHYLEQVGEGKK